MRIAVGLCVLTTVAIVAVWAWLGAAVTLPPSPFAPGHKLYCISYAPFHGRQTPLDLTTHISAQQIDADLATLKPITNCVRTYSEDLGLDQVPAIAQRHGMKVILGIWISNSVVHNRKQIDKGVALAKQYPDVVRGIIVGNEVLLRGEMSATQLAETIRAVKARVTVPVTYADVWEYWLRNRDLVTAVDFVTVHILPYWEDFPVPADKAAAHVADIRRKVVAAFPGKDVLIGETGWPSQGRMREGALPSPINQALVLHDILAQAQRENYPVNVIEAFDQPWKRTFEGTVGGYWGLFDDTGKPKFTWGETLSNHPFWPGQAAGGVALAILVFAAGAGARNRTKLALPPRVWTAIGMVAFAGGACVGAAAENLLIDSLGLGGWLRAAILFVTAAAVPIGTGAALGGGIAVPSFAAVLGRPETRPRDPLILVNGLLLIVATVLAVQIALGLVFDPRYRDFPDASLTAAIVPFLIIGIARPRAPGRRRAAETLGALMLFLCAGYIAFNEGFANWQSLWFCADLLVLAFTLQRARDGQS